MVASGVRACVWVYVRMRVCVQTQITGWFADIATFLIKQECREYFVGESKQESGGGGEKGKKKKENACVTETRTDLSSSPAFLLIGAGGTTGQSTGSCMFLHSTYLRSRLFKSFLLLASLPLNLLREGFLFNYYILNGGLIHHLFSPTGPNWHKSCWTFSSSLLHLRSEWFESNQI